MTDYDDIRTCCTGANICMKCWPYMTMAIKVVDEILREDFGYRHILWIYSGRRGVHCWVCDKAARELPNDARTAVVDYMSVEVRTGDTNEMKGKPLVYPYHPMIRRAYATLEPYFETFIADSRRGQGLLDTRDSCIRVLNSLPNDSIREELYNIWENNSELTGADKWKQVKDATTMSAQGERGSQATTQKKRKVNYSELESWRTELVLKHCYPRLDANVSKAQNHLLKSPFVIHPKTGRVCVPIDPTQADTFDPFAVPTVRTLCDQVDAFERERGADSSAMEEEHLADYLKTDLKDAIDCFEDTFMRPLWTSI
ncbi:PRIM1, partial [Symbiodinium microadriaticum]